MRNSLKVSFALLMMAALLLAACKPAATTAPAEEPTSAPTGEKIELLFWDSWQEVGTSTAFENLIAQFEAENPNITIIREYQDFENLKTLAKTALASGTGPDLLSLGVGGGFMGPLVEAGVLLPLDEYVEKYQWKDRMYPWTWEWVTFDDHIYGIGNELEMIGVYYNKSIFEELGVTPPSTYEEFIDICETAKAAGYIPISFANKQGWPAYHMFSMFANNLAGKDSMNAVLFGDGRWDDPFFVRAIQMPFVEMNQAGYFIPSPNSLEYNEGNEIFYSGQAAMHMTGMWLLTPMLENVQDFEPGFFAFPSIDGKPALPPGGMGSGLQISKATKHPDEAAAFMDFLYTKEAAKVWYEVGSIIPPVDVDPTDFEMGELFRFFVNTIRASSTAGGMGLGYNIDVLTPPEFNSEMNSGFQAVLEGLRTPEEQAAALQAVIEEVGK